ncbi:sodium:proton exchanger [bacterium]|nr:sodium:proton exchanger [bacterium]
MTSDVIIVFLSMCIVVSYAYGEIAKRTNIPSVLLLIITGIIIGQVLPLYPELNINFMPALEILGKIGLIMIVLEGALDLELTKEKRPLIYKATIIATIGIIGSIVTIGGLFYYLLDMPLKLAVLYATPLAVISSAIVIPSINNLANQEKEFLIYESCISDILGIMVFYLALNMVESGNMIGSLGDFSLKLLLTLVMSVVIGIGLILLFKFLETKVKLFFFISILILIFALGKILHLSSLILILAFGLFLRNHQLIFRGPLGGLMSRMEFVKMEKDFHIITRETAFILRTFFFIVFGITIDVGSLLDVSVLLISIMSFVLIILVRFLMLNTMAKNLKKVVQFVAPRGLITVLLFYSIPAGLFFEGFEPGIILYIILITSLYMSYGLITNSTAKDSKIEKEEVDEEDSTQGEIAEEPTGA